MWIYSYKSCNIFWIWKNKWILGIEGAKELYLKLTLQWIFEIMASHGWRVTFVPSNRVFHPQTGSKTIQWLEAHLVVGVVSKKLSDSNIPSIYRNAMPTNFHSPSQLSIISLPKLNLHIYQTWNHTPIKPNRKKEVFEHVFLYRS